MPRRAIATFEVISWDQSTYDEPEGAPPLTRATVRKVFRGEVEGASTAELLMCRPDDASGGYIGSERIVGSVGRQAGSFVVQHGATQDGDQYDVDGRVLPGSGTGALAGIRGLCTFRHGQNGAVFTLDYELPEG